jgi:hypothetical protein
MFLACILLVPRLVGAAPPAAFPGRPAPSAGGLLVPGFAFAVGAVTFTLRSSSRFPRPLDLPVTAILALTLLGVLQLLPLPDKALEKIAPVNPKIYHEAPEFLRTYGKAAHSPPRIPILPSPSPRQRPRQRLFAETILTCSVFQVLLAAPWRPKDRSLGSFARGTTADLKEAERD